ncbi:MAG: hypothetical protein L0H59_17605 [Tomitella sp.]|nr:hypothetical protein [Tomitella sp.]
MPNPFRCSVAMRTLTHAAAMCLALPEAVNDVTFDVDGQHLTMYARTATTPRSAVTVRMPVTRVGNGFTVAVTPDALTPVAASRRTLANPVEWDADTGILTIANMQLAAHPAEPAPPLQESAVVTVPAEPTAALLTASAHHMLTGVRTLLRPDGGALHLDTTTAHTILYGQVPVTAGTADTAVCGLPHALHHAPGLLATTGQWTIGLASNRGSDQVTISDGTVTIATVASHTGRDTTIPDLDSPESGTVWDADIRDTTALVAFLDALPAQFSDDRAYVQIRNPLGAAAGAEHNLDVVARDGNHLAVCGRRVGTHTTRPVTTSSVDEVAIDVPLQPLRALARSAADLGGPLVLHGHRPYVSTSLLSAPTPHGTIVTVARTPQPL